MACDLAQRIYGATHHIAPVSRTRGTAVANVNGTPGVEGLRPNPGRPHIWTNELLPREPRWDKAGRVFAIVMSSILVGVAAIVIVALLELLAISHAFDHINFNLNQPNPSNAPSQYGLNALVSRDSKTIFVTMPGTNRLAVVNAQSGTIVKEVSTGVTPTGLALSPNGREVWVADTNLDPPFTPTGYLKNVTVISTATDRALGTIEWVGADVLGVAFAPNETRAYVSANGIGSSAGEGVEVIDTATLKVVGSLKFPSSAFDTWSPASVAVTPDGQDLWVSSQSAETPTAPGYVYVFATGTEDEIGSIAVGEGSFFMTMSHDGKYAYVADKESCDTQEIDTRTFRVVAIVRTQAKYGCPYGIAATSTDGVIDTVTGSDNTLNLGRQGDVFEQIDFRTSSVKVVGGVGPDPITVTTDPQAERAYVVDADSPFVTVIDLSDLKVVGRLNLSPKKIPPTVQDRDKA